MPIYATRKFRNAAAALMLMSGITHIGQLWFRDTTPLNLLIGLVGVYYLLLTLGLAGQSRFTLWVTAASTILSGAAGSTLWNPEAPDALLAWHLTVDAGVALICTYLLFRTRYAEMD